MLQLMKIYIMKILFLLLLSLLQVQVNAQNSWEVMHNSKNLLQADQEDATANVITIKKKEFRQKGFFCISYTGISSPKDWVRTIAFFDESGNELLRYQGWTLRVNNAKMSSLGKIYNSIKIYTWALPSDPKIAATVRVRRVHLCTINLKE